MNLTRFMRCPAEYGPGQTQVDTCKVHVSRCLRDTMGPNVAVSGAALFRTRSQRHRKRHIDQQAGLDNDSRQ